MYAHARMYALLFVSVYACAACACFFSSSVCVRMKKKMHVMKPCRFESKFCSFVVIANMLFFWCNAALLYTLYRSLKKKLCHARCTYFVFVFTSTCIGRKKIKILHVAKPYRNGSFVVVTNMLPLSTQTRANVNRVDLNWNGVVVCRFCQNASLNTQMLNVSETFYLVQKWKMYVDARMSARFVCMRICMCCVRACMCVSSICAIRKQVWRRFS